MFLLTKKKKGNYFLVSWDAEDSVTSVSRNICTGGSQVGDEVSVKIKAKWHSARICAVGGSENVKKKFILVLIKVRISVI